jgi:hypothetical protein
MLVWDFDEYGNPYPTEERPDYDGNLYDDSDMFCSNRDRVHIAKPRWKPFFLKCCNRLDHLSQSLNTEMQDVRS